MRRGMGTEMCVYHDQSGKRSRSGVLEAAPNLVRAIYAASTGIGKMSDRSGSGKTVTKGRIHSQAYLHVETRVRAREQATMDSAGAQGTPVVGKCDLMYQTTMWSEWGTPHEPH